MIHRQTDFKANHGDLIEMSRKDGNSHWAVYIGDGDVVHLTPDGASGDKSVQYSSLTKVAVIKREPLAEVTGSDPWQVNNRSDTRFKALPVDKIIKKAKQSIGRKVRYNVLKNCEHFVNALRYDIKISYQAKGANFAIDSILIKALVGVGTFLTFLLRAESYRK